MTPAVTPDPTSDDDSTAAPGATPGASLGPSRVRRSRGLAVAGLLALGLVATSCSSGPGSREDFVEVLSRNDLMSTEEASCIADEVFDRYGEDDDALGKLSAAPDFEFLSGEEGIDGFSDFYDQAVQSCVQVGPTSE